MSRWRTHVDPETLRTMRSGLNIQEEGTLPEGLPIGGLYRAIVLKTYATDDPVRKEGSPNTTRVYEVECDILLARSLVPYTRVPVAQRSHGVNDGELWIPRPSTRVIGGGDLNLARVSERGTLQQLPPSLEDLDGDQVLVQFVEGDAEYPIIVGAMSHTGTKRLVVEGSGWQEADQGTSRGKPHKDEKYLSYRGVEVRINDQGDVLIDTVGATKDIENEIPSPFGGQIRVRVKGTERFTVEVDGSDGIEVYKLPGLGIQVDLVEGALQPFVRGNDLIAGLSSVINALNVYAAALGPPGPPVPVTTGQANAAALALATALTAAATQLAAALSLQIRGE